MKKKTYNVYRGGYRELSNALAVGREEFIIWYPGPLSVLPPYKMSEGIPLIANWVFHLNRLGYRRSGERAPYFVALLVDKINSVVLAQSIVTGSSCRFPFMSDNDFQVGAVFVPGDLRGKGYAKKLLSLILGDEQMISGCAWWVCDVENVASNKVAISCGLDFFGKAEKVRKLGMPQYLLVS